MTDWSELEKVERNGEPVKKTAKKHELVKVYRIKDNGRRKKDRAKLNLREDKSIPKEERKYMTVWKCENCGLEFKGAAKSAPKECPEA